MKVVVVGATGNVGTSLLTALAHDDAVDEIVGVARRVPEAHDYPKTRFVARDIVRDDLVPIFHGADVVVHVAWFFQPSHRPGVTWTNNAVGSERLFAAVADAGVPALVYASSVGAYSPGPKVRVDESWPTHSSPVAAYGREKAYVERLLDRFEVAQPSVRVVRFRPAFLFKRAAASEQRRIFAGPFLPNALVAHVPVLPFPRGLKFQALHTDDAADAYRRAITSDARGAYNLAADPVVDGALLAEILGAKLLELPPRLVRNAMATAWHARLAPTEPGLVDLVLSLPLLDASRATAELGWQPRYDARSAVEELVAGMIAGDGAATPPLAPDSARARAQELAAGIGTRVAS